MPLDGIACHYLAHELNEALRDARVDKIQQPSRFDLLLTFRSAGRSLRLLLSANPSGPRLHLTRTSPEMPRVAPGFAMLLRKHLQGARLEEISTPGFERVFRLRFATLNEFGDETRLTLVLEVMGRHSNLILLNHEERILDSVTHVDQDMSRVREVMPARLYQPVPPQDKLAPDAALLALEEGEFLPAPETTVPAAQGVKQPNLQKLLLSKLQGFSPQLADEVILAAGLEPKQRYHSLNPAELRRLDGSLRGMLELIRDGAYAPSLFARDEEGHDLLDYHCLPLQHQGFRLPARSLSEAMERSYGQLNQEQQVDSQRRSLERIVRRQRERIARKYEIHLRDRQEAADYERVRQLADILTANLHRVSQGMTELTADDWYALDGSTATIALDEHRSPAWNSQHYYRQYNKLKSRYEASVQLIKSDEAELDYLDSLSNALEHAETTGELRGIRDEMGAQGLLADPQARSAPPPSPSEQVNPGKPASGFRARKQQRIKQARKNESKSGAKKAASDGSQPLPPRKYLSSDGFTILAGRNNVQNDKLTLRTANKDDLWFHVQKQPGTHVILRTGGRDVPDSSIVEAAQIAAWFSRANRGQRDMGAAGGKLPVDYCPAGQVRKPRGAKPGMVIYDKFRTLLVAPVNPAALLNTNEEDLSSEETTD